MSPPTRKPRDPKRLRPSERATFEAIRSTNGKALFSGRYRGRRAAFIVDVALDESTGEYFITPLAVLLRPCDLDKVQDADGKPLSK